MKFTVERVALQRMVEQLKSAGGAQRPSQRMMQLSGCAARVFVEANGVTAGIEALVLEDGACKVPRMKFLKVLRTYAPKKNITITAEANGLQIEHFVMKTTCFSPVATAPGTFQVFPVTDAWLAKPETLKPPLPPEHRWFNSRWWE